jgi:aspartate--ammonia ligase
MIATKQTPIPTDYTPALDRIDTQRATLLAKRTFEDELMRRFQLIKVSSPIIVERGTGIQDDLAGTQEPVSFEAQFGDDDFEIVHSLAKWKRDRLARYGLEPGQGLLTDMHALRKDEEVDEIHSVYVDQWDWERVITDEQRSVAFLKETVREIYGALRHTEAQLADEFPALTPRLTDEITFLHTEELAERYPSLDPMEREDRAVEEHGAIFVRGIGHALEASGQRHDARAADYDDWSTLAGEDGRPGLNGDIVVWDDVRGKALELSSMGIRVDAEALERQLKILGQEHYADQPFHRGVLDGTLPLSIGGGIGQSRVAMLLLHKAHIGEVQASVWPDEDRAAVEEHGIALL